MRHRSRAKKWNRTLTALTEQGFTVGEAAIWATHHPWGHTSNVVRLAVTFRQRGFRAWDAVGWVRESFAARPAAILASAGWTPEQSQVLYSHFPHAVHPPQWQDIPDQRIQPWLGSGIPPDWSLLYLDAGYDLDAAKALEVRRRHGEDLQATLIMLAALRNNHDFNGSPTDGEMY